MAKVAGVTMLFLLLVASAVVGVSTLSSVRAFVLGEGLWSKGQKRAVIALERYARTGESRHFTDFQQELEIIEGDRIGRLELERPRPDMSLVRDGFRAGGIPEESIDGMATLFRRFRDVGFVDRAIGHWAAGDATITRLVYVAEELREERAGSSFDPSRVAMLLDSIAVLDGELTQHEEAFSSTLNDGAYQVERLLTWIFVVIAMLFLASGAYAGRVLYRQVRSREIALKGSEARYRTLFEENVVGTVVVTVTGIVVETNRAFAQMLGYADPEELEGMRSEDLYAVPEDRPSVVAELHEHRSLVMAEMRVRRKDGTIGHLMASSVLLHGVAGSEDRVLATCMDVTERRKLETRLARTERMEAMGRIAGGVAHDFNNLLTAIRGNAELLEREIGTGPGSGPTHAIVGELLRGSSIAADLTRQLLAFSRGDPAERMVVDLGVVVTETRGLLERFLSERIEFHVEVEPRSLAVEAAPAQLEQVVVNLVVNARDAMPDGGRLTVGAHHVVVDGGAADGLTVPPGSYARLRVADDGRGIDPAVRDRIFEPFQTTKESGTGMGLATVYGIVTQAGGGVAFDSTPGEGTTFDVYLPITDRPVGDQVEEGEPAPVEPEPTEVGTDTVLLVEDSGAVRRVARRILEAGGYRVLEAEDGERALELFEELEPAERPRVVVTDVVMPGVDGIELAERIRTVQPGTSVLFVSGYSGRSLGLDHLEKPDMGFLPKPYGPEELVSALRGIVTGQGRIVDRADLS